MENYKVVNGKRMTCGIIISNDYDSILAGHPTGKRYNKECYDFLKGCAEEGEEDIDCALRELKEESGIDLKNKIDEIKDLGIFNYNREKNIHLFLYRVKEFPNIDYLKCTSYFEGYHGKMLPEMNGFRVIRKNERYLFYKAIQVVLKQIKELS